MSDAGTMLWMVAVAGGPVLLGLAIAYGLIRWRKRTPAEKAEAERGTHEVYDKEEGRV